MYAYQVTQQNYTWQAQNRTSLPRPSWHMSLPFYDRNKKSEQLNTVSGVITTTTVVMIMSVTVMTDVLKAQT